MHYFKKKAPPVKWYFAKVIGGRLLSSIQSGSKIFNQIALAQAANGLWKLVGSFPWHKLAGTLSRKGKIGIGKFRLASAGEHDGRKSGSLLRQGGSAKLTFADLDIV